MASPLVMLPQGYSEEDFIFSKLHKCVNAVGQMVICQVAKDMYSHPATDADNGHMHLRTYCELKNITINMDFFPGMMESDITKKDFDISAANILVKDVCVDLYNSLSEKCKTSIKDLVKMRNTICHIYGCNEELMKIEVDQLKSVIKNIYKGVGKKLQKNFEKDITEAEERIDGIANAKLQDSSTDLILSDIDNFKKKLHFKMISKGRNKLHDCYSKLTVLNPCTWLGEIDYKILSKDFDHTKRSRIDRFKVEKIFTPLKTKDYRSKINIEDLLITTNRKRRKEYLPQALLLEGQAGCGKTSLCRYLVHEWCKTFFPHKKSSVVQSLAEYDLVILVELRRTRSDTFEEFLKNELMSDVCGDFIDEDFKILLNELKLLIIIDGFDEKKDNMLTNDIFKTCKSKRIILTTRTKCLDDAEFLAKREILSYLSVSICGFDYPGFKDFSEKVFQAIEDNQEIQKKELKEFQRLIEEKKHVMRARQHEKDYQLPLTIAFIIILWRNDPEVVNQISTSTRLYFEIFKLFQKKLKERLSKLKKMKGLNEKLNELLLFLGDIAWRMLKKGDYILTNELYKDIKTECENKKVNYMELLSAFLMCETNCNSDIDNLDFMFLHKTQMEYLAATYLCCQIQTKKKTIQEISSQAEDCQEVLVYLTGYMAMQGQLDKDMICTIVNGLKDKKDNFSFWWEVYSESLNNEQIGKQIVHRQLPEQKWNLSDEHVVCGLRFMSTGFTKNLSDLVIDINQDPHDIPHLLEAMKDIKKLNNRWINTEINFQRQNNVKSGTSDQFLLAVNSWGKLTHFVGSLGKKGCQVLASFIYLVSIRARLSEPEAVEALSKSLKKLKKLRQLRVTLTLPPGCQLPASVDLHLCDNLEIWLPEMTDDNKEWMVNEVIYKVTGK